MADNSSGRKDAILIRLGRLENDIERLSTLEQTPEITSTIAALMSEMVELEASVEQLETAALAVRINQVRDLRYKGLTLDEIATTLGYKRSFVVRHCQDIPVDRRRYVKPSMTKPEWLDVAMVLRAAGRTSHSIAKELKLPLSKVYRTFERFAAD
jgi:transposase-like protein